MASADDAPETPSDTARLETFSDGVIAIAITLLVLEITVPAITGDDSLGHELLKEWPSYLGYVVSFLTLGTMWINHHNRFRYIARVNQSLLSLNTLLLMTIAFLPFSTALLAEYITGTHSQQVIAIAVYTGTLTANAVCSPSSGNTPPAAAVSSTTASAPTNFAAIPVVISSDSRCTLCRSSSRSSGSRRHWRSPAQWPSCSCCRSPRSMCATTRLMPGLRTAARSLPARWRPAVPGRTRAARAGTTRSSRRCPTAAAGTAPCRRVSSASPDPER